MNKQMKTEIAVADAKQRVDILIGAYEYLIETINTDIEEAREKEREYSEGMYKGQRMSYKLVIKDLESLRHDIEAIEKAMA